MSSEEEFNNSIIYEGFLIMNLELKEVVFEPAKRDNKIEKVDSESPSVSIDLIALPNFNISLFENWKLSQLKETESKNVNVFLSNSGVGWCAKNDKIEGVIIDNSWIIFWLWLIESSIEPNKSVAISWSLSE